MVSYPVWSSILINRNPFFGLHQHHTRQQKGSSIRKIVNTHSNRRRGTESHAHYQKAEVRRKWEGPSPRPPIRIRKYLLVSISFEESILEGLCEAWRKIKLTYHWNTPIVDQNHMVKVPALKTVHTRASST